MLCGGAEWLTKYLLQRPAGIMAVLRAYSPPCISRMPCKPPFLYVVCCSDQRLYVQDLQGAAASLPKPVTPESKLRYADGVVDGKLNRLITVCEDHSSGGEAVTTVGAIGGWVQQQRDWGTDVLLQTRPWPGLACCCSSCTVWSSHCSRLPRRTLLCLCTRPALPDFIAVQTWTRGL